MEAKKVADSYIENTHVLLYEHMNGSKRLFGGILMQWIDLLAGMVAFRHSRCRSITAAVDNLVFKASASLQDMVVMRGHLTYVGETSMEVRVDTFVENISGEQKLINTAYLVMVALDEDDKPARVPRLELVTEEEQREWELGKKRNALRKQRREEQY